MKFVILLFSVKGHNQGDSSRLTAFTSGRLRDVSDPSGPQINRKRRISYRVLDHPI